MKACVVPLYFKQTNQQEQATFDNQLSILKSLYADEADFLAPVAVGDALPPHADAVVFPLLIGAAFSQKATLMQIELPMIVLTSQFGTIEMWDWEIVTFLREEGGLNVFSPYTVELAKCILRAISCKKAMKQGIKFLMFQDTPGDGMQASIFKRFYWWERECTDLMEKTFGLKIIYKSYKELNETARLIPDSLAQAVSKDWNVPMDGVPNERYLKAVKIYIAVKEVIEELGGVEGVGSNCLNESFNSDTTPCLAWNMLYEKDNILWACEGDTVTLISKFILYSALKSPIMMTNIYPFLSGMAALKHEKINEFPNIQNSDNHALGVHCGYFGLAPQSFCTSWTLRPKVLEIVGDDALMVDCQMKTGPCVLAKIHPNMKKLTAIECEIVDYVQYPGSDCRNGALLHYKNDNGHKVMEALSSHHELIIQGDVAPYLVQLAKVFGFEYEIL